MIGIIGSNEWKIDIATRKANIEHNNKVTDLKELAAFSLKQDFGKDGLNICSVSTFNTQDSLLVNIATFNQTNIKSLNVSFLDLHAICLLETKTISDVGGAFTERYSPHTVINEEYCAARATRRMQYRTRILWIDKNYITKDLDKASNFIRRFNRASNLDRITIFGPSLGALSGSW